MEIASCPILHNLRFRSGTAASARAPSISSFYYHTYRKTPCSNSLIASPANCYYYNFTRKIKKTVQFDKFIVNSLPLNPTDSYPSPRFAVLLEVEGVLMDLCRLCKREAFNAAFKKLGLDCANWSEPVYLDLIRKSAGDEERMLVLYFNRIGWPTAVPTSEKGSFMKNVLREKKNALEDLVVSDAFPLRPGVEQFIDDACEEGASVAILTAYSATGENVARSIVEKLGSDRMCKTRIIGDKEVKQSLYGQLVFGKGVSSALDEQLAKEVSKAASAEKQRIAEAVASMLKLKVELNTTSSESMQNIIVALRAAAEDVQLPIYNCVLVAGSQSGVAAANRIGMPCVVLRSSSTSRAEFPSAIAVMDGFGGADLSVSRLRKKLFP